MLDMCDELPVRATKVYMQIMRSSTYKLQEAGKYKRCMHAFRIGTNYINAAFTVQGSDICFHWVI